jgi:thymidylate kinase
MSKTRISFEGPTGCGKSVLSRFLQEALTEKGVKYHQEGEDDLIVERKQMMKIFLEPDYLKEMANVTEDEFLAELLRLYPQLRVETRPDGERIIHGIRLKDDGDEQNECRS